MATTQLPVLPAASLHDDLQAALGRHLLHCRQARGRWFATASWAERAHGLLAPRLITTVLGASALLWLCRWWA